MKTLKQGQKGRHTRTNLDNWAQSCTNPPLQKRKACVWTRLVSLFVLTCVLTIHRCLIKQYILTVLPSKYEPLFAKMINWQKGSKI